MADLTEKQLSDLYSGNDLNLLGNLTDSQSKQLYKYAYGEDSLTSCCNSYATYIEDERCCKNCRNTVSEDEG
tara:strand:- start:662 stop:877 length:216 start_codon:yes stop_codon:yes gene_type:complete